MIFKPLLQFGLPRPDGAADLVGGPLWFTHALALERGASPQLVDADRIPSDIQARLTQPRAPISGIAFDVPRIMGILNITPDSFSDGGVHFDPDDAVCAATQMVNAGADILDIGGESTRPGAEVIEIDEEKRRTTPVVAALSAAVNTPLSIDTRKADVASAALDAGAAIVNDVSGFSFDDDLAPLCAERGAPVCLMHAQGDPANMQENPRYENVVQDVYAFLARRVDNLTAKGIPRNQIIVDPGIGFGKTLDHNLALLRDIAVFHGLGCPILLGASRKRFIGVIGDAPNAADRGPGSIAVGLAALAQGVQLLRVHDVAMTTQAIRLWQAVRDQ